MPENMTRMDAVALAYLMSRFPDYDAALMDSDNVHRDMMADARRVASDFLAMLDAVPAAAPALAAFSKWSSPVETPPVAITGPDTTV